MKTIKFTASEVSYSDAIDGEIVQVSFDEDRDEGEYQSEDVFDRSKCYVMISQNYEFRGQPSIEWHDGKNYDGGSGVFSYKLTDSIFELRLNNGVEFTVKHECQKNTLSQIKGFFKREFGNST